MSQESRIEVINREGWRKEYPLQKGIVYIGSAPTNDIILSNVQGAGVAPLHVQLIAVGDAGYKLVNLSDQEIFLGSSGSEILPSRAVMNLPEGMSLRLGEFTLIFRGGAGVNYGGLNNGSGSSNIGLRLSLPYTRLAPNQTLAGTALIRNLGGKTGARFDVVLEGLDEDCFDIEPGPLLSSGAEKEISFRLYHHGPRPLAGEWTFVIRATSSNAYPGEQAQLFQTIEILPLYHHRLQLLPAKGIKVTSPPQTKTTPLPGSPKPKTERRSAGPEATTGSASARPLDRSGRARPQPEPEPEAPQEEWWSTSIIDEELPPAQRSDVRHLKAQAVAPPPVPVIPVEPEEDSQDLQATPASAAEGTGEEWGWAVKAETPQPRPVPAEVVSPPPEPPPPAPRRIEPEPAQAASQPEEPEPPVVPPARAISPEPEIEAFGPTEAEAAPVVTTPPVYYHEEIQPSPPPEAPPSPVPKPAPPEVQPVAEPSLFNKWWNRLKEAVPFGSGTTEPDRTTEPVSAERPTPETARDATLRQAQDATLQQAPPLRDFAEEPQGEAAITERPLMAADEPERQDEVAPPIISDSQPTGEVEEQPEWKIQTGAVEPVYQVPEPPVEEPASEPEPLEILKPSPQTPEFEDWWADEVEPAPPAEVSPASQAETPSPSEPPAAAVESPPKTEEWWETIEVRARGKTEENPVIKLKANPAPVKQQPETRAKTNEAEEWWTVDMETSPEQPDKKQ